MFLFASVGNFPCVQVQVSVDVRHPGKGEYGLEIFANDPEKEGDMFTHVCQYLCFYLDGRTEDLYGKVPSKQPVTADIGPEPETGQYFNVFTCAVLFYVVYNNIS